MASHTAGWVCFGEEEQTVSIGLTVLRWDGEPIKRKGSQEVSAALGNQWDTATGLERGNVCSLFAAHSWWWFNIRIDLLEFGSINSLLGYIYLQSLPTNLELAALSVTGYSERIFWLNHLHHHKISKSLLGAARKQPSRHLVTAICYCPAPILKTVCVLLLSPRVTVLVDSSNIALYGTSRESGGGEGWLWRLYMRAYSVLLSCPFPWQKLLWRGRFPHGSIFFRHRLTVLR